MGELVRRRLVVRGRVQGVNFRWFALEAARALSVTGWVRNREDGAVELVAEGAAEAVEALRERCRRGPRSARVEDLEETALAGERRYRDFRVTY